MSCSRGRALLPPLSARLKAAASETGLRIIDDTAPSLQSWLGHCSIEAALIRPDRYVLGTARNENELLALLRQGRCGRVGPFVDGLG